MNRLTYVFAFRFRTSGEMPSIHSFILLFFSEFTASPTSVILMVFSFLQRKCYPLTRCIKNIADQPCYNVIFFEKGRTQILKKGYACVCHLLRSVARSLFFRHHILSACFYNQKKNCLTLNANFLCYFPCSFNNGMLP